MTKYLNVASRRILVMLTCVAGIGAAVFLLWRFSSEQNTSVVVLRGHSTLEGLPSGHQHNIIADEDGEASALQSACKTLSSLTEIAGEALDATGRTLPLNFEKRLQDVLEGKMLIEEAIPEEAKPALTVVKTVINDAQGFGALKVVGIASMNDRPSAFDVWLFAAAGNSLGEYWPKMVETGRTSFEEELLVLSQSQNPAYRLLGLAQAHRLIDDKQELAEFYKVYLSEEDSLILRTLIDRLHLNGNVSAFDLQTIRSRASQRGDRKIEEFASEALRGIK